MINELVIELILAALALVIGVTAYYLRTPNIEKGEGWLRIKHSTLFQILSLGLYVKETMINKTSGVVTITEQVFWLKTKRKVLSTEDLDHIEFHSKARAGVRYVISLVGKDEAEHEIYSFRATSAPSTDEFLDTFSGYTGTIGEEARELLKDIEWFTGLEVSSLMLRSTKDLGTKCPHCGQPASVKRQTCLYCGGNVKSGHDSDEWGA